MNETNQLLKRLRAVQGRHPPVATARYGPGRSTFVGLEHRDNPREYRWDGLSRGGRADQPFVVFQYTLTGFGVYEQGGLSRRVEPGSALLAVVPSAHQYYLPNDSPGWTFFFFLLVHPYIVRRLTDRLSGVGAVLPFDPAGSVVDAASRLYEGVVRQNFRDEFAWEQAAFGFLCEFERSYSERLYEPSARDKLLADVRDRVRPRMDRPIDIQSLAANWGMSRSHFSHHFKATTGLSPARFIIELRLEQVTRQLAESDDKLAAIARGAGFANANHLCKVFRRHFQVSPGEYRKQMR